jgi:hypothetical protein
VDNGPISNLRSIVTLPLTSIIFLPSDDDYNNCLELSPITTARRADAGGCLAGKCGGRCKPSCETCVQDAELYTVQHLIGGKVTVTATVMGAAGRRLGEALKDGNQHLL